MRADYNIAERKGVVVMNVTADDQLLPSTRRSAVRRVARRAGYRRRDVYQLVDDIKTAHVGFVDQGQAVVIPMTVWRVGDHLYFHVTNKSRLQRLLEAGGEVCLSIAETQQWVLSKSAYHHSANYRSAVLYCSGRRVTDEGEFDRAFSVIINQLEPGRWQQVRPPNEIERRATALMKLTIREGAFKSRTGGPNEEPEDLDLPVWHGVIPVCPVHGSQAMEE
jgi:nitroimidazol reductase NimA-like FMN-containing flavoprotein (pyridoxamine 5'-phosphate oxidase superfamily)